MGSINISSHVSIILSFAHLGGWLAASQIYFKVTREVQVMSYAVSLFDSVAE